MNCSECKARLVDYLEGLLGEPESLSMSEHLASCDACRAEAKSITVLTERLTADAACFSGAGLETRVALRLSREATPPIRRLNMFSRHKLSLSAAAVVLVASLAVAFVAISSGRFTTPAYALEQTVEALKAVRTFHVQVIWPGRPPGDHNADLWAQVDDKGQLLRIRKDAPVTEDGFKSIIFADGKAIVRFMDKKLVAIVSEEILSQIKTSNFDPRLAVEEIFRAKSAGTAVIEFAPRADGEPVTMTVTYPPDASRREVYTIDATTKLLQRIDYYTVKDGAATLFLTRAFLDYDKPVDPSIWSLDVPEGFAVIDETTQVIGLPKGTMTDSEITVEVARQFFEALIAKDYAKAGQLYAGLPASKMEEMFGKRVFTRVISIGTPAPQPIPGVGGTVVSFEVEEVGKNGVKSTWSGALAIRPVGHDQPDNWTIHGGI
jgi:hypothetical protein